MTAYTCMQTGCLLITRVIQLHMKALVDVQF